MTARRNGEGLWSELDDAEIINGWRERLSQNKQQAFCELEGEVARAVAEQASIDAAYADAVELHHARIDKLARRVERSLEQLPTPSGVFLSDAEREGAYRVAVALLSDLADATSALEQSLGRLFEVRGRQARALSAFLDVAQALDAVCRAARELEIYEPRLSEWRSALDAVDGRSVETADRITWQGDRTSAFLRDALPKFGTRVSKTADFEGRGSACNPRELRSELSQIVLFLQHMKETRKK